MEIGAVYVAEGTCEFIIYSPLSQEISLHIVAPDERFFPMKRDAGGYFRCTVEGIYPGAEYRYRINNDHEVPDPASRAQKGGVHGNSLVVDYQQYEKAARITPSVQLEEYIIYELHVGTFSQKGDFKGVEEKLPYLKNLGITAIELMPLSEFPGARNWGYDGVFPYCVHSAYGGVEGLKSLVQAAHRQGIAVILDLVYNHLGPEGNYLWGHGIYFTDRYTTPWGYAVNYDGAYSDGVRNYFIENALYWFRYFDIDCLRLDAVHAVIDLSPVHIIKEIASRKELLAGELGREFYIIAESDLNDVNVLSENWMNADTQWCDDFHHSLHTLLTGERNGFYKDFGSIENLGSAYADGFVYSPGYSPNRKKVFGSSTNGLDAKQMIVFSQDHDMVGNRAFGERLITIGGFEKARLAAAVVLLSPFIPMLFMGEEYGETAPFLYFVSHSDPELINNVRKGRLEEFSEFMEGKTPPFPDEPATFTNSKLSFMLDLPQRRQLFAMYQALIALRKNIGLNQSVPLSQISSWNIGPDFLVVRYQLADECILCINFAEEPRTVVPPFSGEFEIIFSTHEKQFGGTERRVGDLLTEEVTCAPLSLFCAVKRRLS